MSFTKKFAQQPRAWIVGEMVALLLIIAALDAVTSYQVRLLPFQAVPIFVLAWFYGARFGTLVALFSGAVWACANWLAGDPELHGLIGTGEISRHLGSFLIVALVSSALRTKSDIAAHRIALLEHSERLRREIVGISDSEQQRIGQDLHDGLCQYLAGLTRCASSLRDDLEKLKLQTEAETADELARLLQNAVSPYGAVLSFPTQTKFNRFSVPRGIHLSSAPSSLSSLG